MRSDVTVVQIMADEKGVAEDREIVGAEVLQFKLVLRVHRAETSLAN